LATPLQAIRSGLKQTFQRSRFGSSKRYRLLLRERASQDHGKVVGWWVSLKSALRAGQKRASLRDLPEQIAGLRGAPRSVPMDAYRRGDQFLIHLDLPGVDPDAIELTVEQMC